MKEVIVAKFTQNVELKASLLATGNKLLVEHTTRDSYMVGMEQGKIDWVTS